VVINDRILGNYSNGNKCCLTEYRHGKFHKKLRWYEDGTKHIERAYRDNAPHGLHIEWDEKGNVLWREEYEHGKSLYFESLEKVVREEI
jgi:antitoxin component YwqK of YwqJK toxin-antitoxin module